MRFTLVTSIVALALLTAAAPQPVEQKIGMAIPITKRSGFVNADGSVDIEALNSHVASMEAKILRGLDNFEKNTGASHPAAMKRIQTHGTGAVPLTDYKSEMWYGSISVGTPPQDFTVDFDTGSSDFFLPGTNCTEYCFGHDLFNSSRSSTAHELRKDFKLKFADKSTVAGKLFTDTVTVAGLTAVNQTFGVATKYSSSFSLSNSPADGLMGMAYQSLSRYNVTPVFQNLVAQNHMDAPVFSFKLADAGSELYLGGANENLYTGDFTYTSVTKEHHWQVKMDNIKSNGETIQSDIDCIIDTGSTLVAGPPNQVAALYRKLGGTKETSKEYRGLYTFPCDSFPDVSFTFGGKSFPFNTLNLGPLYPGAKRCCSGIISKAFRNVSFWVVGNVFLRNVYTKFDFGNSQVGFAQLAPPQLASSETGYPQWHPHD